MANRHTRFRLDDSVVLFDPFCGLSRVHESKRERADAETGSHANGFSLRTCNPKRRMRTLHRLWDDIAAGHVKVLSLVARVGVHSQHVGNLLGRFQVDLALQVYRNLESAQFKLCRGFASAELDATVGHQVESCYDFSRARRMVVLRDDLPNAMT